MTRLELLERLLPESVLDIVIRDTTIDLNGTQDADYNIILDCLLIRQMRTDYYKGLDEIVYKGIHKKR